MGRPVPPPGRGAGAARAEAAALGRPRGGAVVRRRARRSDRKVGSDVGPRVPPPACLLCACHGPVTNAVSGWVMPFRHEPARPGSPRPGAGRLAGAARGGSSETAWRRSLRAGRLAETARGGSSEIAWRRSLRAGRRVRNGKARTTPGRQGADHPGLGGAPETAWPGSPRRSIAQVLGRRRTPNPLQKRPRPIRAPVKTNLHRQLRRHNLQTAPPSSDGPLRNLRRGGSRRVHTHEYWVNAVK